MAICCVNKWSDRYLYIVTLILLYHVEQFFFINDLASVADFFAVHDVVAVAFAIIE